MTGWVRSSACAAGDCIEVQAVTWQGRPQIRIRRNRHGHGEAALGSFTPAEWDTFTAGIKAGEFDQLTGDTP